MASDFSGGRGTVDVEWRCIILPNSLNPFVIVKDVFPHAIFAVYLFVFICIL